MNLLATAVLLGWIPIIFLFFTIMPPRRAVVTSLIVSWLLLPPTGFALPGLPDYTKVTATAVGIFLAVIAFDLGRVLAFRPRWYDAPMLAWCLVPYASSISNGLGAYDGLSECVGSIAIWGLPYVIGRLYFDDLLGLRELAVGLFLGGLAYAPLCLFELRMSPRLMTDVYGIARWETIGMRFGAYRPLVFLWTSLELGMYMNAAALVGFWLWKCGSLRVLGGWPFGWVLAAQALTAVVCRATGASLLLASGALLLYFASRGAGRRWMIGVLLAAPLLYMTTRTLGLWSGEQAVSLAARSLGAERAQSLEFRFLNEDVLIPRALERPLLGWGGWDRMHMWNEKTGRRTIPDGLWVIALGRNGLVGLVAFTATILLPLALMVRRFPMRRWREAAVAPAAALAMLQGVTMVDDLSNGMINPIYTVAAGGLMALAPTRDLRRLRRIPGAAGRRASPAVAAGPGALEAAWHLARRRRAALDASGPGDPSARRDLALECERIGRALADLGRRDEAETARREALALWDGLAADRPEAAEDRWRRAGLHNDLAWALVGDPARAPRDVADAVRLALRAVALEPGEAAFWHTLGTAHYRAGAWAEAIAALERSAALGPGPNAFDLYLLALVHARQGDPTRARDRFAEAVDRAGRDAPGHPGLARLHAEAEAEVGRLSTVS